MRRLLTAAAFLVVAALVTSCARVTTTPARPPTPSAVILAVRDPWVYPLADVSRLWVVGLDGRVSTLPIKISTSHGARLSPDGRELLYAEPVTVGPSPWYESSLRLYDLTSGEDTRVLGGGDALTFGWSVNGTPVAVAGKRAQDRYGPGELLHASVLTRTGGRWIARSLPSSETRSLMSIDFVAADAASVWLQGHPSWFGGGGPYVWRHGLASDDATVLAQLPSGGGRGTSEETPLWRSGGAAIPPRTLFDVGIPVEVAVPKPFAARGASWAVLDRLDVRRLSDMATVRSIAATPPARNFFGRWPVYDATLSRYLSSPRAAAPHRLDLWETDLRTGTPHLLLRGTTAIPAPSALGYAGDQVLFRSFESSQVVVRLLDRATGRSSVLAWLGAVPRPDTPEYPDVYLVGVLYAPAP